jgi:hypothetical protein
MHLSGRPVWIEELRREWDASTSHICWSNGGYDCPACDWAEAWYDEHGDDPVLEDGERRLLGEHDLLDGQVETRGEHGWDSRP